MTISALLMMLTLAVASGTSEPASTTTTTCPIGSVCRIGGNCWINGVWYNPCPEDAPAPDPTPEILLPL